MPDDDFDHFEETPHGPGKGKKKGQSGAGRKYQHEGGISEEYFSEQYTGASGDGMSFDIKQQIKSFNDEQSEWEKQHVKRLTEKTKSRYIQVEHEISNMHKVINLSFCTKWLEMCFQRISICNCFFNDLNIAKYTKLYDEGFEKL